MAYECNAIIQKAYFDTERGLTAWLMLDFGVSGQGFGGWLLYAPKGWKAHNDPGNYAGHFIWRVLEVAEVDDWAKLAGRAIRVRKDDEWGAISAIGHIVKDNWFIPAEEMKALREEVAP